MIAIVEYIHITKKIGNVCLIKRVHKMKKKNIFTNTAFCVIISIVAIIFFMICAEIGLKRCGW